MLNILKRFKAGAYFLAVTAILALVSVILYATNVGGAGYFQHKGVANVVLFSILAILLLLVPIALAFVPKTNDLLKKILPIVESIAVIGAIALLMAAGLKFIGARAEGLGYIFGADANVAAEFTADDYSSASLSILTTVFYVLSAINACVALFFPFHKEEETQA